MNNNPHEDKSENEVDLQSRYINSYDFYVVLYATSEIQCKRANNW